MVDKYSFIRLSSSSLLGVICILRGESLGLEVAVLVVVGIVQYGVLGIHWVGCPLSPSWTISYGRGSSTLLKWEILLIHGSEC